MPCSTGAGLRARWRRSQPSSSAFLPNVRLAHCGARGFATVVPARVQRDRDRQPARPRRQTSGSKCLRQTCQLPTIAERAWRPVSRLACDAASPRGFGLPAQSAGPKANAREAARRRNSWELTKDSATWRQDHRPGRSIDRPCSRRLGKSNSEDVCAVPFAFVFALAFPRAEPPQRAAPAASRQSPSESRDHRKRIIRILMLCLSLRIFRCLIRLD